MGKLFLHDKKMFVSGFKDSEFLRNKSFLITGATGLIGSNLVNALLWLNEKYELDINICLPLRDRDKAEAIFGNTPTISIVVGNLVEIIEQIKGNYEYIIHCASPTSGDFMVSNPVETFEFGVFSTIELLKYAKSHLVQSMVYVSSVESYGQISTEQLVAENQLGYLDLKSPRSSYPCAKRASEFICMAYAKEYGIPVKIARLTQTIGPGISKDDNRVFVQFAKSAISGKDISIKSSGNSSKPYCYTLDVINGLLTILLYGKNGELYNVANDETFCSVNDMATMVKEKFNPSIKIVHENALSSSFLPDTVLKLSSQKLRDLGWSPRINLKEMYERLIEYLSE